MALSPTTLEKLLDSKASSYAGSALVVPVLLGIMFLGSITYHVGKQTAPVLQKILTPPQVTPEQEVDFEDVEMSEAFENDFESFEDKEEEVFTIPDISEAPDMPEIVPTRVLDQTEVAMSETPDNQPVYRDDDSTVDLPTMALGDPSAAMVNRRQTEDLDATLRRGGVAPESPGPSGDTAADIPGGGVALGRDKSGDIATEPGPEQAVAIRSRPGNAGEGVGLARPASAEKQNLTGWILGHPRALPRAVAEALDFSRAKKDRTSSGSAVDETGRLYQFFFLHRIENNLLRILVVLDDRAYRIDLPDFYLEANHVKAGRVFRGSPPEDDPFAAGPVIEVALESVAAIPDEVPGMFALVLEWLEIKEKE
ncbi:hypothetical protein CSB20_14440 [bacterium DOLZORAL124_64_63]|nr:MAG: hypothetical protein CSB20_14440 [bacterium DOLZORAL124_64_63]